MAQFVRTSLQAEHDRLVTLTDQAAQDAARQQYDDPELARAIAAAALLDAEPGPRTLSLLAAILTEPVEFPTSTPNAAAAWSVGWLSGDRIAVVFDETVLLTAPQGPPVVWRFALDAGKGGRFELAWAPDGRQAAIAADGCLRILTTDDLSSVTLGDQIDAVRLAWSPGGDLAVAHADGPVRIRRPGTDHRSILPGGRAVDVAWADDQLLAVIRPDRTIAVIDARAGTTVHPETVGEARALAWADHELLAYTCTDHAIRVWRRATNRTITVRAGRTVDSFMGDTGVQALGLHEPPPVIAWSPDRRLAYTDGTGLRIWDAEGGERVSLSMPASGQVWSLAWSSDGHLACAVGRTAYSWPLGISRQDLLRDLPRSATRQLTSAERDRFLRVPQALAPRPASR